MRLITLILFLNAVNFFPDDIYAQKDTAEYKIIESKIFGNRINSDRFDAPGKVQFIDKTKIQNKNGETLSDVLQMSGNIFVKSYGGNYSLNTISMNGLGSEHTLILLNGFKLNSNQNNQIDLNTISKDNIIKVEILNNGYSSVYGPEAIGGVVNIITKNEIAKNFSLNLEGQVGSCNQRKLYSSLEKSFNNFNLIFNYSSEASDNNYNYYFNNGLQKVLKERANSQYDISNYSLNLSLKGVNKRFNLFSSLSDQSRNLPGIEAGSDPSNANQDDKNWNNILSFESKISEAVFIKSQINFQNNLSHYDDRIHTKSYYKNLVAGNSTQLDCIKKNLKFTTGFDIVFSTLKSNDTENDIKRIQPGIFLVSEIDLNKFKIYPSVRYDHISDIHKNVVCGKFGINFRPFKNQKIHFKASAGNNFAAPTFNELYWRDIGNKNLLPEKSVNFDAGIIAELDLPAEGFVELTYTYINAKDKIVWSPNSNNQWSPGNIGRSVSQVFSIETNFSKNIAAEMQADINIGYSFTHSIKKSSNFENDPTYGKQLFYVPENLVKINLSLQYKKSGLNLFYTYTGKRFTDMENKNSLPGVNLLEGNIFKEFDMYKITTQLKFEVNNILNEDYQMISGYPMALRNYKLVLKIEY